MPNNRPQRRTQSQKGKGTEPTSAKKSASSHRFAARQAAKREAAERQRRARTRTYGIVTIALVVVVVVVLVIVKVAGGGSGSGDRRPGISSRRHPDPCCHAGQAPVGSDLDPRRRADQRHRHGAAIGQRRVPRGRRQARAAVHRRRVLPALCRRTVAVVRRPVQVRHVQPPARTDPLRQRGWRRPHPDVLWHDLHESLPHVQPGGGVHEQAAGQRLCAPADADSRPSSRCGRTRMAARSPSSTSEGRRCSRRPSTCLPRCRTSPSPPWQLRWATTRLPSGPTIDASAAQLITTICGSFSNQKPAAVCSAVRSG